MNGQRLSGVGATFCASHFDPVRRETHGHSYEIWAWFAFDEPRDAIVQQEQLKAVVASLFDHKALPAEMSRAEDMAAAVLALLTGCVEVEVRRPLERLSAKVRA